MVEIKKDKKAPVWIVTTTDKEGFHRNIWLTKEDLEDLYKQIKLWREKN